MGNFEKLYMRPNLENSGQIPAGLPLSSSPDIWLAGDNPVSDYKTSLITDTSYGKQSENNVVVNKDNFIYVRAKNGSSQLATNNITLYYADGSVIQWPSKWVDNVIGTDLGKTEKAQIINLAPGAIGIGDRPFVWRSVPPYKGNCHYCLIAQINDDQNSNPFPSISSSIDMGKLVSNNLRWGWRNINTIDKGESVEWCYNTMLTVPVDIEDESREYILFLNPVNVPIGCKVAFTCSQPDSKNHEIVMNPTEVTGDGQIMGCKCTLEPGFTAMVTVYLYNPLKKTIPLECALNFEADYYSTYKELEKHNALELFNMDYNNFITNNLRMECKYGGAIIRLGGYSGVIR